MPGLAHAPRFTQATRRHTQRVGPYQCTLLTDIQSSGVQYRYILEVVKEGEDAPCFFVASEVNALAGPGGGSHFLGSFVEKGHVNHGTSNDWADEEKFLAKALSMVAERYGVGAAPNPGEGAHADPAPRSGPRRSAEGGPARKGGWRPSQQLDMSPCSRVASEGGPVRFRSVRPIGAMLGAAIFTILLCGYVGMFIVQGVSMSPAPTPGSTTASAKRHARPIGLSFLLGVAAVTCWVKALRPRYVVTLEADRCVLGKGREEQVFRYDEIHSVLVTSTITIEQRGSSGVQIPGWQVVAQLSPSVSVRMYRSSDQGSSMAFATGLAADLRCPDRLRVSDVHARI
jgi:hypothetical protein